MTEDRKKSLGEFLRTEREKRNLTIEQTSSATKIGLKILKRLEADEYSELPALPFVRGFVRNYGKFLGLDGEQVLQDYSSFLEEHSRERPKRDAGHSGYAFERPEGEQSRKILWGVMAGMLLFGGAVVFLFKPSLKRKHHAHMDKVKGATGSAEGESQENAEPVSTPSALSSPSPLASLVPSVEAVVTLPSSVPVTGPQEKLSPVHTPETPFVAPDVPLVLNPTTPSPVPSAIPSALPLPLSTPAGSSDDADLKADLKRDPLQTGTRYLTKDIKFRIILRTKANIWVRYQCDDKQVMKFALLKGRILVLRGKIGLWLQVSNPESATLQVNGGPEILFSETAGRVDYEGNSTLVWPLQDIETIKNKLNIGPRLPPTADPKSENLTN